MTRPTDPHAENVIARKARELAAKLGKNPAKLADRALALYRSGWTVRDVLVEVAA